MRFIFCYRIKLLFLKVNQKSAGGVFSKSANYLYYWYRAAFFFFLGSILKYDINFFCLEHFSLEFMRRLYKHFGCNIHGSANVMSLISAMIFCILFLTSSISAVVLSTISRITGMVCHNADTSRIISYTNFRKLESVSIHSFITLFSGGWYDKIMLKKFPLNNTMWIPFALVP